jgi:hypothetical protein
VIHGEALAPWLPGVSLDAPGAAMILPPFGRLELDLGSLVILGAGVCGVDGSETLTGTLDEAAAVSLAGIPFAFQALVAETSGARFTNARGGTILDY